MALHSAPIFAEDTQEFACAHNFFKFCIIMSLTGHS